MLSSWGDPLLPSNVIFFRAKCFKMLILVGVWSNQIQTEGLYGRFDHARRTTTLRWYNT